MKKCNCNDLRNAASCPVHKDIPPARKFLKHQFMGMGVEWLAEEVLRLRRQLRKYEKSPIVSKGKMDSKLIDRALSNPTFKPISHSDAYIVSLIMGVAPDRRKEAYERLKNKMGDVGYYIAKEQGWV